MLKSFGSEERDGRAVHNVITDQSVLSKRSRPMSDSSSGAFQLLRDSYKTSLIQNCLNVEAQKILHNDDWSVSRFELLAFIALLCVRGK